MKKYIRYITIFFFLSALLFAFGACQDMLETDSDRIAFEEGNQLNTPSDTLYTVLGLFTQLQQLGDRYVLMGELRGDLMETTENASVSLKEINDFQMTSSNVYSNKYDYYKIINNCNYAITHIDTMLNVHGEKALMPEYAAIKAIRAWTYMQLVQIFGKASYIETPILDLQASLVNYPEVDMDGLASLLIKDLLPYAPVHTMNYGFIDGYNSHYFFIPVSILLGDLYLYQNQYEQAATMYYNMINSEKFIISDYYTSTWTNAAGEGAVAGHKNSYLEETLSAIVYSSSPVDLHSELIRFSYNDKPAILPARHFVDSMAVKPYFYANKLGDNISAYMEGDLRGMINIYKTNTVVGDAYMTTDIKQHISKNLIYKYFNLGQVVSSGHDPQNNLLEFLTIHRIIPLYRLPQIYLRYAEAVNRAGKPTLAFAVLKHGLTNANIHDATKVNQSELRLNEPYINFSNAGFDANVPMASRGRGNGIPKDKSSYVIPDFTRYVSGVPSTDPSDIYQARQDSINWVELHILDEMAAETPFDGSRFFDLWRMSRRRDNHPEFMAEKVAARYPDPAAMKSRLMNMNVWFLK